MGSFPHYNHACTNFYGEFSLSMGFSSSHLSLLLIVGSSARNISCSQTYHIFSAPWSLYRILSQFFLSNKETVNIHKANSKCGGACLWPQQSRGWGRRTMNPGPAFAVIRASCVRTSTFHVCRTHSLDANWILLPCGPHSGTKAPGLL